MPHFQCRSIWISKMSMKNNTRIDKIRNVMLSNSKTSTSVKANKLSNNKKIEIKKDGMHELDLSILAYENWKTMANFILHENMSAFRKSCKYINKALYLELRELSRWLEKETKIVKEVNHNDEKSNEKHNDKSNKSKSNKHILHLRNKTQKDIPKIKVDTEFLVHKAQENKSRERELNDNESESDLEEEIKYDVPDLLNILNEERNKEK